MITAKIQLRSNKIGKRRGKSFQYNKFDLYDSFTCKHREARRNSSSTNYRDTYNIKQQNEIKENLDNY